MLFVFIDGFGIGCNDPLINPLADWARYPVLSRMLHQAIALDASMGVEGLPQSATGQTALLTGINASGFMKRHVEGFPPEILKEVVRKHNIFSMLNDCGRASTFANAYWIDDPSGIPARSQSVTTVAALAAFGRVRGKPEMLADKAVYHDLTRELLRDRGYKGQIIAPEEAARHLLSIAAEHDFTLFEFFETDRVGHSRDRDAACRTLDKLERFFCVLHSFKGLLVVSSDHGNIEDMTTGKHTANFVPLYVSRSGVMDHVRRIEQVAPAVLKMLSGG